MQDIRDWHDPQEIREALCTQACCVCPDFSSLKWTLIGVVAPSLFFLRYVLPRARQAEEVPGYNWSCTSCTVLAISAVLCLIVTSCRNPGVVPRASKETMAKLPVNAPPRYLNVNGVVIRQRWCHTCRVYRPLRSKHCSYCERCVFRFDHHCTWLGNCVGIGNYRSFLALVLTALLFFGQSALITLKVVCADVREDGDALAEARKAGLEQAIRRLVIFHGSKVVYFLFALVLFFALTVLILYHGIIVAQNLTTNEHVRDYYMTRNPFDIACADNYRQICCAPYGRVHEISGTSGTPKSGGGTPQAREQRLKFERSESHAESISSV